jgi:exosome complex RNA-binding protein Csl4
MLERYYCECCGNEWEDYDDTEYVKCNMCGAKEERKIAQALVMNKNLKFKDE